MSDDPTPEQLKQFREIVAMGQFPPGYVPRMAVPAEGKPGDVKEPGAKGASFSKDAGCTNEKPSLLARAFDSVFANRLLPWGDNNRIAPMSTPMCGPDGKPQRVSLLPPRADPTVTFDLKQ